jgi:CheY-like chemotaxis protein
VAKILVADDNSNIQKMVALALKDQGIEVVAVGNGEAAVRKISDVRPDLVLADIFMPVRNGYEVCKFVKENSALSHIPVILLVGAFDPLDEQEAQRVGADGVLKKPFVPPDPLISMVKSALARAGVALGTTATPPPPVPAAAKVETPTPRIVPPPPVFAGHAEEEFATPQAASRPAPFSIDKGSQTLAFGSLLDLPAPEDDAVFATSQSAAAVPERDWGSASTVEEEEEVEEPASGGSWRVSSSLEETVDAIPAGQTDWREAAFSGIGTAAGNSESVVAGGWAPSVEKQSLSITEEEAAALARERETLAAMARTRGPEDWGKAIQEVLPEEPQAAQESPASTVSELPLLPPPPVPEVANAQPSEQFASTLDANSWMAGAVSPWGSEAQRASQLAATWDSVIAAPASVDEEPAATREVAVPESASTEPAYEAQVVNAYASEPLIEKELPREAVTADPEPASPAAEAVSSIESLLSPATQEVLHEETAHAVAEQASTAQTLSGLAQNVSSDATLAAQPHMDEIVAKVLAKMNPEVMQAVTREILKPLVEAMIKDELQKK